MPELKTRSYTDQTGTRTTLRFDDATWRGIELVASRSGLHWPEWIRTIPAIYDNRHTDVRTAVVERLIAYDMHSVPASAAQIDMTGLLIDSTVMNDEQLAADLADKRNFVEEPRMDYGGFALRVGLRQGQQCLWIENGLRGRPHFVFPVPKWIGELAVGNLAMKEPR